MKSEIRIPGNYEGYQYQEAKKAEREIEKQIDMVKSKFKAHVGRIFGLQKRADEIERQIEAKELDDIFNLDLDDTDQLLSPTSLMSPESEKTLDVEQHFEYDRKNNIEEDAQIA